MSDKEKHFAGREPMTNEQIEESLKAFRKELAALRREPDAAPMTIVEEMKREVRRLKAIRLLRKRQMKNR